MGGCPHGLPFFLSKFLIHNIKYFNFPSHCYITAMHSGQLPNHVALPYDDMANHSKYVCKCSPAIRLFLGKKMVSLLHFLCLLFALFVYIAGKLSYFFSVL
jgi:hypothetical protein